MGKTRIRTDEDRCTGCSLCVLSCSMARFGVFSTIRSSIKVEKEDRLQRFSITVDGDCIGCGQCAKACSYGALAIIDADTAG